MSASLRRLMVIVAAVKRPPTPAGTPALGGTMAVIHPAILCTPLDPVNAETAARAGLSTPHGVLRTFADAGLDVRAGDYLVVDGRQYPVRSAASWTWRGDKFQELILEELRR